MHRSTPCLSEEQLVVAQIHDGVLPALPELLSGLGILQGTDTLELYRCTSW